VCDASSPEAIGLPGARAASTGEAAEQAVSLIDRFELVVRGGPLGS
jgi:hypothetical protein